MNLNGSFGNWLRQRRRALDLTQAELADQVGCSTMTIRKIEADKRRPSKYISERLADVLAIALEDRAAFIAFARQMNSPVLDDYSDLKPTGNLPLQATPFIGRERELAQIAERLADPTCRLLTLVGPGGIGKTRLAIQAALDRVGDYAEGVYFVSLTPVGATTFIPAAIASAVQFLFYGQDDPAVQIVNYLRAKHMLLVLDNYEHLLEGVGLLSDIVILAPCVKLMVTSRERLNMAEEWVLPVMGLPYPDQAAENNIRDYSAVELFAQTARRIQPDFSLDGNQEGVIDICRAVEGMPLGLELAATWLRAMPSAQIAEQIRRDLDFLATPLRNVEPRQRSLRAVFDHSWGLLTEVERDVVMKLSVFRGGCDAEAAEQVAGASLRLLAGLVDKSLVRLNAAGRYEMHELLRQFGEEHLNDSVEETARVRDLHCLYYANFMALRKDALVHGDPKLPAAEIDTELENVRSAWNRMVEGAKTELIEKSLIALNGFYLIRGLFQEGTVVFGKVAERFREEGNLAFALAVSHQALCFQFLGDHEKAVELYQQGLAGFRHLGIATQTAFCLEWLSEIARATKDYDAARQYIEEAWRVIDETDESERWRHAFILPLFGHIAFMTGDLLAARQWYEEALTVSQVHGVQIGVTNALYFLGNVELAMGIYTKAEEAYQACLKHSWDIDYKLGCIEAFAGLGEVELRRKAYSEAKQYFREALQLAEKRMLVNLPIMRVLVNTAELFIEQERYEWAAILVAASLYHPVSEELVRDQARKLLPRVEAELQPHIFAAAWERGKKADAGTLKAELLMELNQPSLVPMRRTQPALPNSLGNRELEILHLVALGCSNSEIAERLVIAVSTVKWHLNEIFSKLDVKSRTQATRRAKELHLLS